MGQEDDGPQGVGHARGQAPIALDVPRDGVRSAPILHRQHDETAAKLLGLWHRGWARPKQDGRVRFIGAADKRNLTISTVVTMTGTIIGPTHRGGRHETSGTGPARAREDSLHIQREPLVHREHVPRADRMA